MTDERNLQLQHFVIIIMFECRELTQRAASNHLFTTPAFTMIERFSSEMTNVEFLESVWNRFEGGYVKCVQFRSTTCCKLNYTKVGFYHYGLFSFLLFVAGEPPSWYLCRATYSGYQHASYTCMYTRQSDMWRNRTEDVQTFSGVSCAELLRIYHALNFEIYNLSLSTQISLSGIKCLMTFSCDVRLRGLVQKTSDDWGNHSLSLLLFTRVVRTLELLK